MRFYETEKPRAVLIAWDTLDAPTYRHDALPGYQSGREFDDELVDQLEVLPEFVTACGFACAKAARYEGKFVWDTSKPNGQPRRRLDVTRAKERFGFEARTSFDRGVAATVAWFEEHQEEIEKK